MVVVVAVQTTTPTLLHNTEVFLRPICSRSRHPSRHRTGVSFLGTEVLLLLSWRHNSHCGRNETMVIKTKGASLTERYE